ncbi:MAG: BON domain-containing protein [Myxococcales bacterium]|nr:BON domain-containing protein [Myxococcales bacterium]MCB9578362.1 BON domain-containing protein [Polyangiaceae bacterium]
MFRSKWITCVLGVGLVSASVAACDQTKSTSTNDTTGTSTPATDQNATNTTTTHEKLSDSDITQAVERRLFADGTIHDGDVVIKTTDGVVQLIGHTDNLITKKRAELLASTVKGVRSISNRIEVKTPKRADSDIQNEVEHALMFDAAAEAYEIDVTVKDQVVKLTGKVDSWTEQKLAERIAEGVRGVKRVDDQIQVNYDKQRPDSEVLADVQARLRWDALVDQGMLQESVEDGVVTLSGVVGSLAEKLHARNDAWKVVGVKNVKDDDVDVEWWAKRSDLRANRPTYEPDGEIDNAIEDALLIDPRVSSFDIDVSVDGGVVTLKGNVTSLKAKRAAAQLANDTTGVRGVKNLLQVSMTKPPTDAVLADRVRSALLFDPLTSGFELPVTVKDGVATLNGTVNTYTEKAEAEDAASAIAGIKDVKNQIDVKSEVAFVFQEYSYPLSPLVDWKTFRPDKSGTSDASIQSNIANELFWSPFLDSGDINVRVDQGVATLSGTVDTWRERNAATTSAYEGGATIVKNELSVK